MSDICRNTGRWSSKCGCNDCYTPERQEHDKRMMENAARLEHLESITPEQANELQEGDIVIAKEDIPEQYISVGSKVVIRRPCGTNFGSMIDVWAGPMGWVSLYAHRFALPT